MSAVLRGVLEHSIQSAVLAQQEIQALHTDNQRLAAERAGTMKVRSTNTLTQFW